MDRVSLEVKVGVVVTLAVGLVVAFLFLLGEYNPFTNTYTLNVTLKYAGGIKPGSDVQLAGAKVGKVKSIRFLAGPNKDKEKNAPVLGLELEIDKRAKELIRKDSVFNIQMESLLGGKVVEITPGTPAAEILADGAVVRGIDPPKLEDLVNRAVDLLGSIDKFLDQLSPEDRERMSGVLASLARVDAADIDNLKRTLGNFAAMSDDLKIIAADASPRLGPMLDDLQRALNGAGPLLSDARGLVNRLDRLAADVRQMAPENPAAARKRVDELLGTAADLQALADRLERFTAMVEREYGDISRKEVERIAREFLQQQGITINVGTITGKPHYPPPPKP